MTGVEAVSDGVQAFREPVVSSTRKTLAMIVTILILLLMGLAYLVHVYHISATEPGTAEYESVLAMFIRRWQAGGSFIF